MSVDPGRDLGTASAIAHSLVGDPMPFPVSLLGAERCDVRVSGRRPPQQPGHGYRGLRPDAPGAHAELHAAASLPCHVFFSWQDLIGSWNGNFVTKGDT